MSVKLSQEYVRACFDNDSEKLNHFIDESSVEEMLHTGVKHIGDDINLVNLIVSDDKINLKHINYYESNSIAVFENDITWITADGGVLHHAKSERFFGCSVFQWNKGKLQRLSDYGAIPYEKNFVNQRISQRKIKYDEPDASLKAKEIYQTFFQADFSSMKNHIDTNAVISSLLHGNPVDSDEKIDKLTERCFRLRSELIDFNLGILSLIQSENTCILESSVTGIDSSGSSIEIRECFISEWVNGLMVNGRVYSVKVPSAEDALEFIEEI